MLAVVSDPFMDQCYGLCRDCLGPIYEKQGLRLREQLGITDAAILRDEQS